MLFRSRCAASVELQCFIGGVKRFPKIPSRFAEFWIAPSDQLTVCDPAAHRGFNARRVGILQFTIYTPEALGKGYSLPLAEKLKEEFSRAVLSCTGGAILMGKLKAFELNVPRGGYLPTIIDASYDFFLVL